MNRCQEHINAESEAKIARAKQRLASGYYNTPEAINGTLDGLIRDLQAEQYAKLAKRREQIDAMPEYERRIGNVMCREANNERESLVQGGQGRSDGDVQENGEAVIEIVAYCFAAFIVIVAVMCAI